MLIVTSAARGRWTWSHSNVCQYVAARPAKSCFNFFSASAAPLLNLIEFKSCVGQQNKRAFSCEFLIRLFRDLECFLEWVLISVVDIKDNYSVFIMAASTSGSTVKSSNAGQSREKVIAGLKELQTHQRAINSKILELDHDLNEHVWVKFSWCLLTVGTVLMMCILPCEMPVMAPQWRL